MPLIRNQQQVTVNNGDVLLLPSNGKRKALIIGTPKTNTVWISFVGAAGPGVGIPLRPGQAALILVSEFIAEALTEEIRASCEGLPEVIGVVEILG